MLKQWLAKVVIALFHVLAWLPAFGAKFLAVGLGIVCRLLMRRRRHVVATNLELCFPEWTDAQRASLLREVFASLGMSFYEIAITWCRVDWRQLPECKLEGVEHIQQAVAQQRGVLLICGHFNCIEISARYIAENLSRLPEAIAISGVYRPLDNPLLEQFQSKGRGRYAKAMISKRNPRAILKALKTKQVIWMAPDQDFGLQRSEFIPFFNIPTATLTATWRLAKQTQATVLTMWPRRLSDGSYHICVGPPLPGVNSESPEILLTALNQRIETAVRASPADYWWLHRRFKTTPPGMTDRYAKRD